MEPILLAKVCGLCSHMDHVGYCPLLSYIVMKSSPACATFELVKWATEINGCR